VALRRLADALHQHERKEELIMSLTVHFTGICTHVPGTGGMHRVVLVRADNGAFINDAPLPPHIPMLRIKPSEIQGITGNLDGLQQVQAGAWRLCGVQLTLDGLLVPPQELSYDASFEKIPHLSMPVEESVPALSTEVLNREQAACYVDLYGGRLSSEETEHKAIMGRLDVEMGADPQLKVKCFWNQKTSTIHLAPGATIHIEHIGIADTDSDKDFLFHYRVFDWVHPQAHVPPEPKSAMNLPPGSVSIGCSNSQYP
jgi:hypothetical protein